MNPYTKVALVLWVVTIGSLGYFFLKGSTAPSTDNRVAVLLNPQERDMVLGEMRTMLTAVGGVLNSLGQGDPKKAAAAAKSAGMAMAVDATPGLMAKLPLEFKTLGMSVHGDFDALSADIDTMLTERETIKRLGAITSKCITCHAAYRLGTEAVSGP